MNLPPTDVRTLAGLARLDVTDEEAKQLDEQISRIVEYVGQLQAVTTDTVATEPPVRPGRPDVMAGSQTAEQILAEAPERSGQFWKVKTVK